MKNNHSVLTYLPIRVQELFAQKSAMNIVIKLNFNAYTFHDLIIYFRAKLKLMKSLFKNMYLFSIVYIEKDK